MNSQISSSTHARGMLMVFITTVLWGILPVMQKMALKEFTGGTVVWFRFFLSFAVLYPILHWRETMPWEILRRPPWQGVVGGLCLAANYITMIEGIRLSGPSNAGILIQTAPVMVVLAGVLVFKERMEREQIFGFFVAVAGFFVFYLDQSGLARDAERYQVANLYVFVAAVVWVGFMICQKMLSQRYGPQSLNLLVFATATLALAPAVQWEDFLRGGWFGWGLLIMLGLNTLFAYGALAEAVRTIPLTYISTTTTLNPLLTVALMQLVGDSGGEWLPPDPLGFKGVIGALTAVAGVTMVVRKR